MRRTYVPIDFIVGLLLIICATSCSRQHVSRTVHGWTTYRNDTSRTGNQPFASKLSDPQAVKALTVKWTFTAHEGFSASPIIANGTVFIGSSAGHFYALDEDSGSLKWRYPNAPEPPLISQMSPCKIGACYGIGSSASYWDRDADGAVIFGAQDPTLDPRLGSSRLYALNARTGALIWKSDPVAIINGTNTSGKGPSLTELHERIKYSSPLIFNSRAYIGISDAFFDRPIQNGRVVAVDLQTGHIDPNFSYLSTGNHHGGDVWNSPAASGDGVYFTTGNSRRWENDVPVPEPSPNHGLSMIRVDKNSGAVIWAFQPVPYALDDDPDWAAEATVMTTSCGELVASVQKDGWAYAVNASTVAVGLPNLKWQFPPSGSLPFTGYIHGNSDYKHPGAAWNDVFIVTAGGEGLTAADGINDGYGKLQALNACEVTEANRVRWIVDIPNADLKGSGGPGYAIGTPTVTGGIVFIGTNQGHLVALADPSVWPASGSRCSNVRYATADDCLKNDYVLIPVPAILANVTLPDAGNISEMRDEAALADGKVFVASNMGHVYMLAP
jgi:outer membrane protein assembly factor BamB